MREKNSLVPPMAPLWALLTMMTVGSPGRNRPSAGARARAQVSEPPPSRKGIHHSMVSPEKSAAWAGSGLSMAPVAIATSDAQAVFSRVRRYINRASLVECRLWQSTDRVYLSLAETRYLEIACAQSAGMRPA